jgi:hypothetical protein
MYDKDYLHLPTGNLSTSPITLDTLDTNPSFPMALQQTLAQNSFACNREQSQFVEYCAFVSSLKRLMGKATNQDWFTAHKHEAYQLAKVTCKQMITNLWT